MKYLEHITNHIEKTKTYFLEQYKNRQKINALLTSIIQPMQDIEDTAYSFYDKADLSVATDYHLDRLGAIIGIEHKARNDSDYRFAISLGIVANNSGGTPEEILAILHNVYENKHIEYLEYGVAYFQIFIQSKYEPKGIQQLLQELKPAGVSKPIVIYAEDDNIFRFSERISEVTQSIVRMDKTEFDTEVVDTLSILSDLQVSYDKLSPLEPTNSFAEIIINRPDLLLDDNATYMVDSNDDLQMVLAFSDYTIKGGSKFAEVINLHKEQI